MDQPKNAPEGGMKLEPGHQLFFPIHDEDLENGTPTGLRLGLVCAQCNKSFEVEIKFNETVEGDCPHCHKSQYRLGVDLTSVSTNTLDDLLGKGEE